MIGRPLIAAGSLAMLMGCQRGETPPPSAAADRPNVLLITLDTVRADHLSCYGESPAPTPALDGLARRGSRFAQAFAQAPLTAPSHASILTGTYPVVHGIRDNGGFALSPGVPTLAGLAKESGYETVAFVAAAVLDRQFGLNHGFGLYADVRASPDASAPPGTVPEIRGHVVTDRALAWFAAERAQGHGAASAPPFLAWVHYFDAHAPYDPPAPFRERYQDNPYAGEVASVDHEVGRLLGGLEELGLLGSTLVVAVGDHGEGLGDHGEYTHGVFLYDSTLHIPLLVAGPGVPAGRVVGELVRSIDVLPTVAELAGFSPGQRIQGVSLRSSLEGRRVRTSFSFAETLYPRTNLGWADLRAVRTDEFKLVLAPRPELYRLGDDPSERNNVYARFPSDVERLAGLAQAVVASPAPAVTPGVSPETREQLRALGYVAAAATPDRRHSSELADPKDRVQILRDLDRAERAIHQRDYAAAADVLERAARKDPSNPAVHGHLVHCFERLGDIRKAIRALKRAIGEGAAAPGTWTQLGSNLLRVGDVPGATRALEKAVELDPYDLRAALNLATAYLDLDRLGHAERVAREALERRESLAEAWNVLGIVAARRGRPTEARGHFRSALTHQPDLADPYLNLGLLAEQSGQIAEAARLYREFLSRVDRAERARQVAEVEAALSRLDPGR